MEDPLAAPRYNSRYTPAGITALPSLAASRYRIGMFSKIVSKIEAVIWQEESSLGALPRVLIRVLRVLYLSLSGFTHDRCSLRSSALTFFSLLSIVPILALIFGIAKGFGFEKVLEARILATFYGQEEVVSRALSFARSLLENTQGGLVAGIGLVLLFWSVIKALSHIENSLNSIWGVDRPRTFIRRYADYLSIVLVCPILLIMSSSVLVLLSSQAHSGSTSYAPLSLIFSPLLRSALATLPIVAPALTFAFLYLFLPNTKVRLMPAIVGGFVAGILYAVMQYVYVNLQIGASQAGAIYGSFAALPLFLVWLQSSWMVILFGAEVSYATQNLSRLEGERRESNLSPLAELHLALYIVVLAAQQLITKSPLLDATGISQRAGVSDRFSAQVLSRLRSCGLLAFVGTDERRQIALTSDSYTLTPAMVVWRYLGGDPRGNNSGERPLPTNLHIDELFSKNEGETLGNTVVTLAQALTPDRAPATGSAVLHE